MLLFLYLNESNILKMLIKFSSIIDEIHLLLFIYSNDLLNLFGLSEVSKSITCSTWNQ